MADVGLAAARAIVARAIDKAEALGAAGAFVVVGESGSVVTASRMDAGGAGGPARARSKAWISATQRIPSHVHLHRMTTLPAPIAQGFLACSPEARFPGAGGLPLDGGGFAASGASVGPFVDLPDPRRLIVDGKPANSEDLIVAWAVDRPYVGLHGDDEARWVAAYGALPDEPGLGHLDPGPAADQPQLTAARALADRVLALAAVPVAVAVVDRRGEPWQLDAADGCVAAGLPVAEAVAAAAASFGVPSEAVDPALAALLPLPAATAPGGVPLPGGGAIGIGGPDPDTCRALATEALA